MNLKEQRAAALKAAQAIVEGAKDRDLTPAEVAEVEAKVAEVKAIDARGAKTAATMDYFNSAPDADGATGKRLALTGRGAKAAAAHIAAGMVDGTKALVPAGSVTTDVPLVGLVETGQPLGSLLAALPTVQRDTPTWRYLRQSGRTNLAAIVAAGGLKPTSTVGLVPIDGALSVFAHMSEPVDKFTLSDNASLQRFVAAELLYMLSAAVEEQVLNGAGTAGTLSGILATGGIQVQAYTVGKVETLRAAITALETAGYEASTIVLNPVDWAAIESARSTSGSFDLGGPIDRAARKVWGVPVVTANALAAGTGVIFDNSSLAVDIGPGGIETRWSDQSGDLFDKNQLKARVEGRFGLDMYQPEAIVKATLTGV